MEYHHHIPERIFQNIVSMPFIYVMIVPLVIFDIFLEIYHHVCFPLYAIPQVKRSRYIRIDRQKLSYVAWYDKINCMYCGYANGLLHYATEIAARTETYWCGIKHKEDGDFVPQPHQKEFLPYGDEKAFKEFLAEKHENCALEKKNDA